MNLKFIYILSFFVFISGQQLLAQIETAAPVVEDSVKKTEVVFIKDSRLDALGSKLLAYNSLTVEKASGYGPGYKIVFPNFSDRDEAMKVRAHLLKYYPEHSVNMTFQSPYIRLKFGDFTDKKEAYKVRDALKTLSLITGNVYVVSETVRVKVDKTLEDAK